MRLASAFFEYETEGREDAVQVSNPKHARQGHVRQHRRDHLLMITRR